MRIKLGTWAASASSFLLVVPHLPFTGRAANVEIKDHSFFLGPSGRLQGKIHGLNVRIRGQMTGEINATEKVEITREAKFEGKINCKSLHLDDIWFMTRYPKFWSSLISIFLIQSTKA